MPESKLEAYIAKVRAYLATAEGARNYWKARLAYGYGHAKALAGAVMHSTHLVVYERITAVVEAIQGDSVRRAA